MKAVDHLVYIVDDDERVREALRELLASAGLESRAFGSAAEYLRHQRPAIPGCLVLDVRLPDINGLDLQKELATADHLPIVIITGHGDIPMSVRAMKAGAVDFLAKPFSDDAFLNAVRGGLEYDRKAALSRAQLAELKAKYESLTTREKDVLPLIVAGLLNKQGASELGISPITFQIHRSNVMRKMKTHSVADLVRIAARLDIPVPGQRAEALKS
jgi:FixJ family two-component response regulator